MITPEEISITLSLFKWIHPSINEHPVLWESGDEISEYRFYQFQKNLQENKYHSTRVFSYSE